MFIETLENRRLFAVTVGLDATGTLSVTGTTSGDTIGVTEKSGQVTVTAGRATLGTYLGIKAIVIDGGAGSDTITYNGATMGAAIYGRDGSDIIYVTDPTV